MRKHHSTLRYSNLIDETLKRACHTQSISFQKPKRVICVSKKYNGFYFFHHRSVAEEMLSVHSHRKHLCIKFFVNHLSIARFCFPPVSNSKLTNTVVFKYRFSVDLFKYIKGPPEPVLLALCCLLVLGLNSYVLILFLSSRPVFLQ